MRTFIGNSFTARAAALLLGGAVAILGGCSSNTPPMQSEAPPPIPQGGPTPRAVTDLASISSAPAARDVTIGSNPQEPAPSATAESTETAETGLRRLFLDKPESEQFAGTAKTPGNERLLNAKAAEFSGFSHDLLHQVFVAAQKLERGDFSTTVLPEDVQPVVITAIMSKEGKLKELIIERASGSGAVDHLMVDACKKGLWATNPPQEALTSDGVYKIRIQGRLKNFNTMDQRHWNFETHVGLALL